MAVAVVASPVTTADELLQMPDDGMRYELVRGELLMMSPAGAGTGGVRRGSRGCWIRTPRRPTAVWCLALRRASWSLTTRTRFVRQTPRFSEERFEAVGDTEKYWPGAPDFAAEVISPKDTFHEVQTKALEWLAAGTIIVLVLDPDQQTATVYRGQGDAHAIGPMTPWT